MGGGGVPLRLRHKICKQHDRCIAIGETQYKHVHLGQLQHMWFYGAWPGTLGDDLAECDHLRELVLHGNFVTGGTAYGCAGAGGACSLVICVASKCLGH